MKHNHHILIITCVLIVASLCTAMENNTIIEPKHIAFPDNNTIVIGGENGCGIFDAQSQQLIHKLTSDKVSSLVANDDIVAFINRNKEKKTFQYELIVFNKNTSKQMWLKDGYYQPNCNARTLFNRSSKLAISSIDNTLFVSTDNVLTTYDYIKQQTHYTDKSCYLDAWPPFITCHPRENTIFYSDDKKWLYTARPNYTPSTELTMNVIRSSTEPKYFMYLSRTKGHYSSDGNVIAFNNVHSEYFICNLQRMGSITYELLPPAGTIFIALSFYPHASILALLSNDYVIHYLDYKLHTLVAKTRPLLDNTLTKISNEQLAFSPNGKQLGFLSKDQWIITQTPNFNTNFALIYALLKHTPIVPDLILIIIQNMFQLTTNHSKLSYINRDAFLTITPLSQQNTITNTDLSGEIKYKSLCLTKKLKVY